jgi:TonB family protein
VRVWFYPQVLQVSATGDGAAWPILYAALTAGWSIGVCILLLRRRPDRRPSGTIAFSSAGLERRLRAALFGTSIPRSAVKLSDRSEMPHVRGWWSPRIHLSASAITGLDTGDLRAVLLHEDAHRQRRDPLRFAALQVAGTLLFFYPPIWWLIRRIRETTEMACDEAALAAGLAADEYAGSLARMLRLGLAQTGAQTAILGRRSSLRKRFARLSRNRRFVTMKRHRFALACAVLLVAAASFVPVIPASEAGDDSVVPPAPPVRIEGLGGLEETVDLDFLDTRLATVLDTLGRHAGFEVSIGSLIRNERISLRLDHVTVGQALAVVAQRARVAYSVPRPGTLHVERSGPLLAGEDDVTKPVVIPESKVAPVYPESMRAAGLEGRVMLQALIDEAGNVGELEVLEAQPKDHEEVIASAIDAVSRWRYEPATHDGKPVAVYFTLVIQYRLDDKGKTADDSAQRPF